MARQRGKLTGPDGAVWHMVSEAGPKRTYGARFMIVFTEAMQTLARDRTASPSCLPVLFEVAPQLSGEGWKMLRQADVAAALGLGATTISRALADLEARGILERRGAGPRQEWRFTPKGIWRGTAASHARAVNERAKGRRAALHVVDGAGAAETAPA